MKTFECKACGHIEFNEPSASCLICRSPQTSFAEKPAAIQKTGQPGGAVRRRQKAHPPDRGG